MVREPDEYEWYYYNRAGAFYRSDEYYHEYRHGATDNQDDSLDYLY